MHISERIVKKTVMSWTRLSKKEKPKLTCENATSFHCGKNSAKVHQCTKCYNQYTNCRTAFVHVHLLLKRMCTTTDWVASWMMLDRCACSLIFSLIRCHIRNILFFTFLVAEMIIWILCLHLSKTSTRYLISSSYSKTTTTCSWRTLRRFFPQLTFLYCYILLVPTISKSIKWITYFSLFSHI